MRYLERGSDDVVAKPFSYPELRGRVRAVLRRSTAPRAARRDPRRGAAHRPRRPRTVRVGGTPIDLSAKEYALLAHLAAIRGGCSPSTSCCATCGASARCAAHADARQPRVPAARGSSRHRRPRFVENVWGVGYRLARNRPGRRAGVRGMSAAPWPDDPAPGTAADCAPAAARRAPPGLARRSWTSSHAKRGARGRRRQLTRQRPMADPVLLPCRVTLADGTTAAGAYPPAAHTRAFLRAVVAHQEHVAAWVEIPRGPRIDGELRVARWPRENFHDPTDHAAILAHVERHAHRGQELFCGIVPKVEPEPRKEAAPAGRVVWVDIDRKSAADPPTLEQIERLLGAARSRPTRSSPPRGCSRCPRGRTWSRSRAPAARTATGASSRRSPPSGSSGPTCGSSTTSATAPTTPRMTATASCGCRARATSRAAATARSSTPT